MRAAAILIATLLAAGISACSVGLGDECLKHCWRHLQEVPDEHGPPDMTTPPDDRFDDSCTNIWTASEKYYPPRPLLGAFQGTSCPRQAEHDVIRKVVRAIEDPAVDAYQTCDPFELEAYVTLVDAIANDAHRNCVDFLTCDRTPWDASCDIDPFLLDQQACTIPSAEALCASTILGPAQEALADLTGGPGSARPINSEFFDLYSPKICDFVPDMAGSGGEVDNCEDGGPVGVDESGSDGSGSDETGMGLAPFGDVDELVACTAGTCWVEDELFTTVVESFSVFYEEGVRAEWVEIADVGSGVRLSGLDDGEYATDLLARFDVHDGDVITHVDGDPLDSASNTHPILAALPNRQAWALTLRRWTGARWQTRALKVSRLP